MYYSKSKMYENTLFSTLTTFKSVSCTNLLSKVFVVEGFGTLVPYNIPYTVYKNNIIRRHLTHLQPYY